MNSNYKIKEIKNKGLKQQICKQILRDLPEWFGIEKAVENYIIGVKDKYFLAARVSGESVGFLVIKDQTEFASEVYVMGVLKEFQRQGIGQELIAVAGKKLRQKGKKFLTAKTLGPSRADENYEQTRKFYRQVGFYPLEESTELWGEENPCLFMVKELTRPGEEREAKASLEKHLRQLEERLLKPEVRQSFEKIDELLTDEFIEFGSSGAIYKKEDFIGGIPPVKMEITSFEVELLAPNVALTKFQAVKNEGSDKEEYSLRSSIWKQMQGSWQLIFHQGTLTDKREG